MMLRKTRYSLGSMGSQAEPAASYNGSGSEQPFWNAPFWNTLMALPADKWLKVLRLAAAPALVVGLSALAGTAQAQFFGDRYYNNDGGYYGNSQRYQQQQQPRDDFFGDRFIRPAPPPADYSKAPPPRKLENPPSTSIVVIGDSLADWLAYGLDETYSDQPDMGVVRKIKPTSGLVRYDAKNDALDWSAAIKDVLASEKPNAIVVMLGLNDRLPLRDRVPPKPVPPKPAETQAPGQSSPQPAGQSAGQTPGQAPGQPQAQTPPAATAAAPQNPPAPTPAAADSEGGAQPPAANSNAQPTASGGSFDFHTDKWAEIYGRRIDEMINALKAKGVPILWVGLPAIRGTKSTSDMAYMDEIYRERADKAGIAYVDIWDGFVDDQGRYTVQGPDFEGQTRKLRTADGVHFTKAGAVKLASYVDQELRRIMQNRATPVALPGPDATAPKPAVAVGTHPDVGPVVPLAAGGGEGGDLLGGGRPAQITSTDPVAAKVLTRGDAIAAPTGRADDFAWPRHGAANPTTADTGPLPGPEQAAPTPTPKKGADAKKQPDAKAADAKTKPAPDQNAKPHRAPSASLDGAPRPPKDVGGGF
jgi:hypothetical protein